MSRFSENSEVHLAYHIFSTGIVKSALSRLPENNEVSVENLEEKRGKSSVSGDKESDVFTKPRDDELWMLELFHGPTAVFKDLALSFVASALEYFLNKNKRNITIIVGEISIYLRNITIIVGEIRIYLRNFYNYCW